MTLLFSLHIQAGITDLFIDLYKAMGIVLAYFAGRQLVQTKGYEPEDKKHTYWQKTFVYLKAVAGCFIVAFILSNLGIPLKGITASTIEALGLLLIPCIAGIEHSYKVNHIKLVK